MVKRVLKIVYPMYLVYYPDPVLGPAIISLLGIWLVRTEA